MEHVRCSLCGAEAPHPWLETKDRFSGTPFQLVVCNQCGLIYLSPRPTMEELAAYYPEEYEAYQPEASAMSAAQSWHTKRMWEMQAGYLHRFKQPPGRLLDVGCATGEFLNAARARGWQVRGIELIEQSAQLARERYGLEVSTGMLETVDLAEDTYDAITMWDVLEHLPDPRKALEQCHWLLKRGGVVIFSIPNLASFDRYLFGSRWIGWDAPRHFTLFGEETLKQALDQSGFSIVGRHCFLGGKGTFLLSLDNLLAGSKIAKTTRKMYTLISAVLWPYRQLSYLVRRGPILAVAARKQERG